MHTVYILYSSCYNKYYVGETADINKRLEEHNSKAFLKSSTTFADDWRVVLSFLVTDRVAARKVERYIKDMKSKKFIEQLVNDIYYREVFFKIVEDKFQIIITKD